MEQSVGRWARMTTDPLRSVVGSPVVIASACRVVLATGFAMVALAVVAAADLGGPLAGLSVTSIVGPYVLYEAVAVGWRYLSGVARTVLVVAAVGSVGAWLAIDPVVNGVGGVLSLLLVVGLDVVPIEGVLAAVTRERGDSRSSTFGPPSQNGPDTRGFPHAFDESTAEPTTDGAGDGSRCPDCGEDLGRLLVGRACPNCGYYLRESDGE